MGAVANADVPLEKALEAAGIEPDAIFGTTTCAVHDEGFFRVGDMEGFEVRAQLITQHLRCALHGM